MNHTSSQPLQDAGFVGHPNREDDFDVWPGFVNPPSGYGEVAFYWWMGDPLTRERLSWQLDRLEGQGIMALQINYAHDDKGGNSWGLTYASEPPLFSEEWWDLFGWFLEECKRRGMTVSLSDYTLCAPGQGWWSDEILREEPTLCGSHLTMREQTAQSGDFVTWPLTPEILSLTAFRLLENRVLDSDGLNLSDFVEDFVLRWQVPSSTKNESWKIVAVLREKVIPSLDPMNSRVGALYVEKFFGRFEARFPQECGCGLNFFFSDELELGVAGNLWTDDFSEQFKRRKGYAIESQLPALFMDIGSLTPKIRLDYRDVMVELSEENFFRPIYEWHTARGMIFGCDHGGRGRDVVEFGDYFRTQRWTSAPGNDSPRLESDVIKNKVASSIAHLYERPRTWLEGFYGSGWGTSIEEVANATFRNFVMGHNLLTLHGLYYSTHGSFWEWAPPCNHFRMPYWKHMQVFLRCSERLCYLLSQGRHRCDVAILYPVAPVEAGMNGDFAVQTAFSVGEQLFDNGLDFDFLDFQSLERATISNGQLHVAGESYRVLILPALVALRFSTLEKALAFKRAGGIVLAVGALPRASDRAGRDDAHLDSLVAELFGTCVANEPTQLKNAIGGVGAFVVRPEQTTELIDQLIVRDFAVLSRRQDNPIRVLHRHIGVRDVFFVVGVKQGDQCFLRATGRVEQWNPWTGSRELCYHTQAVDGGTVLSITGGEDAARLFVFSPEEMPFSVHNTDLEEIVSIEEVCGRLKLSGLDTLGGNKNATVFHKDQWHYLQGDAAAASAPLPLDGFWEVELQPTLENRWGDFRLPATDTFIGAEARNFAYREESATDFSPQTNTVKDPPKSEEKSWTRATCSFGPYFWKLGPLPPDTDVDALERHLASLQSVDSEVEIEVDGEMYGWQPVEYSMRWGAPGDPGHQGYHGLKAQISDDFLVLGQPRDSMTQIDYEPEVAGTRYYLWTSAISPRAGMAYVACGMWQPSFVWLDGARFDNWSYAFPLAKGAHPLLLRFDGSGRTHFVLKMANERDEKKEPIPLSMRWDNDADVVNYDCSPHEQRAIGRFRFQSPPGLMSLKIVARGAMAGCVNGQALKIESQRTRADGAMEYQAVVTHPEAQSVSVELCIEIVRGHRGGAALPEPVELHCENGSMMLGDWSQIDGLENYSGGVWYRKNIDLTLQNRGEHVLLELGEVAASAEVHINGQLVGIKVAPPWTLDVSPYMKEGRNRIEILVFNTLANHYATIPTRYHGSLTSGLLGPVRLRFLSQVVLQSDV